ncbi:hypothetical protein TNCT_38541 [Trichonephila clavata]|uniref:Secreted protein n=1 Tax=Trichonephila clavata TaxID=2740835 RepID=A0A8X6IWE9_TRICU|nr:hypothetical protein TNCT_38541 [Trichonephila clavata]
MINMELNVKVFLFVCLASSWDYSLVCTQNVPPENRVVVSPLAVGGMLQGLLSMQEIGPCLNPAFRSGREMN